MRGPGGTNTANASACFQDHNPIHHHGNSYPKGNKTFCCGFNALQPLLRLSPPSCSLPSDGGTFDGCDEYMADQARAFARWANEDPRVVRSTKPPTDCDAA